MKNIKIPHKTKIFIKAFCKALYKTIDQFFTLFMIGMFIGAGMVVGILSIMSLAGIPAE